MLVNSSLEQISIYPVCRAEKNAYPLAKDLLPNACGLEGAPPMGSAGQTTHLALLERSHRQNVIGAVAPQSRAFFSLLLMGSILTSSAFSSMR